MFGFDEKVKVNGLIPYCYIQGKIAQNLYVVRVEHSSLLLTANACEIISLKQ